MSGGGGGGGGRFQGYDSGPIPVTHTDEECTALRAASPLCFEQSAANDNIFPRTTERNVGMTHFVNETTPFRVVLKQRYSDFLVNEIGVDGKVCHLTDQSTPPSLEALARIAAGGEAASDTTTLSAAARAELTPIIGDDDVESFAAFVTTAAAAKGNNIIYKTPARQNAEFLFKTIDDKAQRSALHAAIRMHLGGEFASDTLKSRHGERSCDAQSVLLLCVHTLLTIHSQLDRSTTTAEPTTKKAAAVALLDETLAAVKANARTANAALRRSRFRAHNCGVVVDEYENNKKAREGRAVTSSTATTTTTTTTTADVADATAEEAETTTTAADAEAAVPAAETATTAETETEVAAATEAETEVPTAAAALTPEQEASTAAMAKATTAAADADAALVAATAAIERGYVGDDGDDVVGESGSRVRVRPSNAKTVGAASLFSSFFLYVCLRCRCRAVTHSVQGNIRRSCLFHCTVAAPLNTSSF
jgi:hypothetical protein